MSFKNVPIPEAAEKAGMTKLVFAEDFETETAIDFSGEGKPGYSFYADRPYGGETYTPEECPMRDSVLYMKPIHCSSAIGIGTYSKKGDTGFTMHYGYAEARIRADRPVGEYDGVPAFWGIGKRDYVSNSALAWKDCGELDILEINMKTNEQGVEDMFYTGTLHHHHRPGTFREDGRVVQKMGTNFVNALGYNETRWLDDQWHTYAALWEPGYVAWYLDGKLMHSARFSPDALPEYFYRDDPTPLPRFEETNPWAKERTWVGAHSVMDEEEEVIILGCNYNWPMEVDWVRVWQK